MTKSCCTPLLTYRLLARLLKRVQPSTGSFESLNDIHYWLRECDMSHIRCAQRRRERVRQTPTRLLQVQPFEPSSKVHLRQAAQIPENARYATLSHCWGQYMPVKLQRGTFQAFLDGIDVDRLPLTFQQAIVLTRSLGIEYVWIDSLCIIQDDENDWANECTRMTSVYMNSFINIGANAARDSRGGLFQQRSWKSVSPLSVQLTYVPTRWHRKPVILWPNPQDGSLLDDSPLADRGWVVQERLLASRTVHFLRHKVVWECDECQASETDVTGKLEDINFSKRTYLAVPVAPRNGSADRTTQFLSTWSDIVRFYSAGKLSVPTDKLVAISGVAKYMFENRQDNRSLQYYAGHWSHNFEVQLTWSASYFSVGSRSRTYVAPSWSWASYNGEVLFPRPGRRNLWAQLINIEIFPESDPFGAVSASSPGYIRMRGPLCRATTTHLSRLDDEGSSSTLRLLGSGVNIECVNLSFEEPDEAGIVEGSVEQQNSVIIFGIMQGEDSDDRPFEGIILQLTGVQRGQYRRIGAFRVDDLLPRSLQDWEQQDQLRTIFGGRDEEAEQDHFGALVDEFGAMNMPNQFFEQKGDGWYEFTII
jgi:hypothetical protein